MALRRNNMQQKLPSDTTFNPTHIAKTSRKTRLFKKRHQMSMVWENIQRAKFTTKTPKNKTTKHNMANRHMPNKQPTTKRTRNMGNNTTLQQKPNNKRTNGIHKQQNNDTATK